MGTRDMDSVPPATMISAEPPRMRSAASAMACRPEEQKRLMVIAEVSTGRPARRAAMRATFMPCSPSGMSHHLAGRSGWLAEACRYTCIGDRNEYCLPQLWKLQMWSAGLVSFGLALCRGKKAVDVDAALGGDVDATVGNGGNREAESVACTIARGILRRIVEFVGDIGGVVGEENSGLVWAIPNFGGEDPNDAVFGAVRGNGGRAGIVDICGALGDGLRGEAAILQSVIPQIIVHQKIEDVAIPVGGSAEGLCAGGDDLHRIAVIALVKMAEIVAIEFIELRGFTGGEKKMGVR